MIYRVYLILQLAELQNKVRSDVSAEYMLGLKSDHFEKQLFDWSMMRMSRPSYGVRDAFGTDSDNYRRKKRDAEAIFYFLCSIFPSLRSYFLPMCFLSSISLNQCS